MQSGVCHGNFRQRFSLGRSLAGRSRCEATLGALAEKQPDTRAVQQRVLSPRISLAGSILLLIVLYRHESARSPTFTQARPPRGSMCAFLLQ